MVEIKVGLSYLGLFVYFCKDEQQAIYQRILFGPKDVNFLTLAVFWFFKSLKILLFTAKKKKNFE